MNALTPGASRTHLVARQCKPGSGLAAPRSRVGCRVRRAIRCCALPSSAPATSDGAAASPSAVSTATASSKVEGAPAAAAAKGALLPEPDAPQAPADGAAAAGSAAEPKSEDSKSEKYNEVMNRRMGTNLTYQHELGLDYNRILPDLIVGSCLQTAADVDRLAEQEGVTTVFCLQEDTDMAYFSLDIKPIQERCAERGDIKHVRFPIHDFDPYDLRRKLPRAVSRLAREHKQPKAGRPWEQGEGKVPTIYIHCTAGMGRAPATALAYMYWVRGMQLDEAHKLLTSLRRCGPKIEAIRSATCDLLLGTQPVLTTIGVTRFGSAKRIQVAGLDVGWHQPLDMSWDVKTQRFVLHRKLYPGKYQYKFIVDGVWSYSADHPTAPDGFSTNNTLEVIPANMAPEDIQKQMRLLSVGSHLTDEEQEELRFMLDPWHNDKEGPTSSVVGNPRPLPDALQSLDQTLP